MRLIQQRNTPVLLPRLSTLCLRMYGPGVLSVLSPALRSVVVHQPRLSKANIPTICALMDVLGDAVAFPRLETFYLDVRNIPLPSLQAPPRMTSLRRLSILGGKLTHLGLLADLSTLPYLETLEVQFSPSAAFVVPPKFPSTPFVALKSLGIEAPALCLYAILEVLPVGGLQSLAITPLNEPFELEGRCHALLARYFQIMSSRFSASMTTLVMEYGFIHERSSSVNAFGVSVFEPLIEMRKLQEVDLSQMHWAMKTFGDNELAKFASAWPAIQELKFPTSLRMKATIRTLQSFATGCPHLRHLEIPFDGQVVEESTLPMTSCPLEMLRIGDTPIPEDKLDLARNLAMLFPSLQAVYDTPEGGCVTIKSLVQEFQAVRAEKRTP